MDAERLYQLCTGKQYLFAEDGIEKASAQEDYLQSKAALLPSLQASTSQNINYTPWVASGISGDGYTKSSIDKVYYNGTYSVAGNYTIGMATRTETKWS